MEYTVKVLALAVVGLGAWIALQAAWLEATEAELAETQGRLRFAQKQTAVIATEAAAAKAPRAGAAFCVSMSALIGLSVALGVCGGTVMNWIRAGAALL